MVNWANIHILKRLWSNSCGACWRVWFSCLFCPFRTSVAHMTFVELHRALSLEKMLCDALVLWLCAWLSCVCSLAFLSGFFVTLPQFQWAFKSQRRISDLMQCFAKLTEQISFPLCVNAVKQICKKFDVSSVRDFLSICGALSILDLAEATL